jgi:P pilus assembly chaperone PapD
MISPYWLNLPHSQTTAQLDVTNDRDVPVTYEFSAFAWEQRPDDEMVLTPSADITATPDSLTVGPHEKALVKVELAPRAASEVERTYRVKIREASVPRAQDEMMQMLAAMTVPVFVVPEGANASGGIDIAPIKNGKLEFAVQVTGNAHVFVKDVEVSGQDKTGQDTFRFNQAAWYILAGGRRDFHAQLSRKDCNKAAAMKIRAQLLDGGSWEKSIEIDKKVCGKERVTGFPQPSLGGISAPPGLPKFLKLPGS